MQCDNNKSSIKRNYYEELFNRQVSTLKNKYYLQISDMREDEFLFHIKKLKQKVRGIRSSENGHIPFLIVIPKHVVSIQSQLIRIKVGSRSCPPLSRMMIDFNSFKNAEGIITPDVPYLIFDIDDGASMLGVSSDNYKEILGKQNRQALTVEEGIALVTHYPEVLQDHAIDMLGSSHVEADIPVLWLNDGWPYLSCRMNHAILNGGAASCGGRIVY